MELLRQQCAVADLICYERYCGLTERLLFDSIDGDTSIMNEIIR